ncbi:WecB/TagA/CpsF family glycosyltransferase [Sphingomonas echinoides]|uniref:WecB/TagA/CpsF family glycosyltransferase n=1 Tax=Sphingomonas echinoides TaxID=59803 RepID=UPI0024137E7D|nr:WecB/TagA/CpsF family glycosyltransferase [Sphingomonas echinoides]
MTSTRQPDVPRNDRFPRTTFLDLDFDTVTAAEVVAFLRTRTVEDRFGYIVTPNVDHMVQIDAQPELRPVYQGALLCLNDSRVLARLAKLYGIALTVVPGSDLIVALFGSVLQDGDRLCIVGASAPLVAQLRAQYPRITIVHHEPPMGLRRNAAARQAAVDAVAAANARFTLLAVGAPQQEILASEMAAAGTVTGTAFCIGAAVDFIVGAQVRAPRIVQQAGMEWFWRLAGSPRRLGRRYLVEGPKIFRIALRWQRNRRRSTPH